MKKQLLTKMQRYTVYCILLEESEKTNAYGLCWLIRTTFGLTDCGFVTKEGFYPYGLVIHKYFPELMAKKTSKAYGFINLYWFPNWSARRKALREVLEEMERELFY